MWANGAGKHQPEGDYHARRGEGGSELDWLDLLERLLLPNDG